MTDLEKLQRENEQLQGRLEFNRRLAVGRAQQIQELNERLRAFESAVTSARSWLACCDYEPPDFDRLRRMLERPYEDAGEPVELETAVNGQPNA